MRMLFRLMLITVVSIFILQTVSFAADSISPFLNISDGRTLVSEEGIFELGFFSPGTSTNRYLGIWYKKIPVRTVIWVANRCSPIHDFSGLLTINSTGNLAVLNQNKSVVVWSTNLSKQAKKPIVQLLDSGNLVLRDEEDKNSESYLWQSFDYPADTLLPGMKLGWDIRRGLNRRLSAWKNWDDPCPGDLSFGFDVGLGIYSEVYLRKGVTTIYRTGPWNGIGFSSSQEEMTNRLYDRHFVYNSNEFYYMYNLKNNSVISIVVLNQTNSVNQRLTWSAGDQSWRSYVSAPKADCDYYGYCGANGNCIISETAVCKCLKGFKPKSQQKWDLRDWSDGCIRKNPLNCHNKKDKDADGFVKLDSIKMPDSRNTWFNDSMNLKECRVKCLSNCSCAAYSNLDIRGHGKGCCIWFDGLMDISQIAGSEQELYIRIPASELGQAKITRKLRAIIVLAVLGALSGLLLVGYYFCKKTMREKTGKNYRATPENRANEEEFDLPLFDMATLSAATDNFSVDNKLGEGGFGPVYRGTLEDGQEIAVKRLSLSSRQGTNEFKNEVILIAKLQHRNLVKLLGCCIQEEEKLLVYEYMPNKSLESFIVGNQVQSKLLEWKKRFEIICGIARGLQYLHQDSRLRIVHRDLKLSNILLDNERNPKISDFGMAKSFGGDQIEGNTNRVVGTYGYMAPEYAFSGLFSIKSDVFSFGVMVLEIVSGKRSISFHHENKEGHTFIGHAWTLLKEGRPFELIDAHLMDSYDNLWEVSRCIHVGLLCVQQRPVDRPNMSSVIIMLGSDNDLPQPNPPGYFMDSNSQERYHSSIKPESLSENTMTITAFVGR
ncbi:G-type lectin S-receptor-like serine/threonine-protein kinase At4g27290 [Morus notabilis]|uniref:G-type lectin S-receptor-like serine/threonine-protein kinase At4g27290 n=1 Tax=Morus notabilis TaxID=981085 RepID=UPI000CECE46D|nr:G-type lectin S-receptor-like serine/threonine-protein kinase At4g27290 [Morus notabilis]